MKIYVIDDDKNFLTKITRELEKIGCFEIKSFDFSNETLEFIKNNLPDLVIINNLFSNNIKKDFIKKLKKIDKNIIYLHIIPENENINEEYIKAGIDEYLKHNYTLYELKIKINFINKFITLIKEKQKEIQKLKNSLKYKNIQEELAIIKQKKLLKDELFMFFENNNLIETYTKPKDALSGDSLFTKRIKKNEYILAIVDAMGKGLNASLTSITTSVFLEYSIEKSIEMKDFDFKRCAKDFFHYAKAILLHGESLCAVLIYIKNEKLYYVNFGMPPIYTSYKKYKANNPPIIKTLDKFEINQINLPDKFFIFSDGLIESRLKNKKGIYYENFLKKNNSFLKNLVKDFEKNAIQDDDISIIHYKKDKINKKIFEIDGIIENKKNIDLLLEKIPNNLKSYEKIIYILQELFMNTLEHGIYELHSKKEKIYIDNLIAKNKNISVQVSIFEKNDIIKIVYKENSKGFDVNILKDLYKAKYHGKGIKIIKFLSEGVFFNYKGNEIKIFIKEKK